MFAHICADAPYEPWMRETVVRTDQRARKIMGSGVFAGECLNQRTVLNETDILVAVVNGADDPFINIAFIREAKFKNLWNDTRVEMPGLKHAPFWGNPTKFESLLVQFLEDCD